MIYQTHAAGAEIYPSLGGWSLSDPFPAMSANSQTRATFVQKCIELIIDYNFDGIDLDWEYPGKFVASINLSLPCLIIFTNQMY